MTEHNGALGPTESENALPVCKVVAVVELFQLASQQIADAETRQQLLAHIEACATCKQWYTNAKRAIGTRDNR